MKTEDQRAPKALQRLVCKSREIGYKCVAMPEPGKPGRKFLQYREVLGAFPPVFVYMFAQAFPMVFVYMALP